MAVGPNFDKGGAGAATATGRFITLEGGECAGKSTQIKRLTAWLAARRIDGVTTREPGGSPAAEMLRDLLLAGTVKPFGPDAEALLFAVARADHMDTLIRPALDVGRWVVCDRFMDSTRAYQGADGVSDDELDRLEEIAVGRDRPDLTLLLDLSVDAIEARMSARDAAAGTTRDRFEAADRDRHQKRRDRFLAIATSQPERCVVIDAERDEDAVFTEIAAAVSRHFDLAGAGEA